MKIIGMMSGTSGDGIDAALCEITGEPPHINAKILHGITVPYSVEFQRQIWEVCSAETGRVDKVCRLNMELGERFAEAAIKLMQEIEIKPDDVDLIGSHGQTIWHEVLVDGSVGSTLQIGESAIIAERTGITTISNFRARDVAAGGQGAPLTAYADWLLLRHEDKWRAVQNIGGIGNVTFLPPKSDNESQPLAFDTGSGNVLIDGAISVITDGKQLYDRDGAMARRGMVDDLWLSKLLKHPYYELPLPKTTGRELFSSEMAEELVHEGRGRGLTDEDIVATLTALTASSIAEAYRRYAPAQLGEVILGGGGHRNPILVRLLKEKLDKITVLSHEDVGLSSDFKEALVFALLAYETWHMRVGNHPSLTGAKRGVVLGQIASGMNYVDLVQQTWCR